MYSVVHKGEEGERRADVVHMAAVACQDAVVEDKDMAVGELSEDSDRAALRRAAVQERSAPSDENGEGLEDMYKSQKSCCVCNWSDRDNVDRAASLPHTLVDRGQVAEESSRSNQSRRQPNQDVERVVPFAGEDTHPVAIAQLCEMARDV